MIKVGVAGPQRKSSRLAEAPAPGPCRLPSLRAPPDAPADWGSRGARSVQGGAASARLARHRPRPHSVLSAAAQHLQLTLPKFPAPARWPRCVRPRVRRAGGPSLLGSPGRTEQARRRRCWRRGFKETATSPQFAGPRWGCSRFPASRSTVGPFPGSGRHSAAAPEEAGAQGTGSGDCRYLCVYAPGAGAWCACPVAAECVYIWGHAEEVEPWSPGGRRDQRNLLPLPHSQDLELDRIPSPLRTAPPTSFHQGAGLGEWRARIAPRSLHPVWH